MRRWQSLWHIKSEEGANLPHNLLLSFRFCDADAFPNIYRFLLIACTLPITSAEAERSFSLMRRLKTYARSTMSEERLSDLAVIAMHYKEKISTDYRVIHQSPDASNHRTPSKYRTEIQLVIPTSIHLRLFAGGERIYGCKERPFIASGLRLPRATNRPFYSRRARGVFSRLYEVQIHRYSTYMCLAANQGE